MLENYHKIHIVGIGGISLSAIALILKKEGKIVTGTDVHLTNLTKALKENFGIPVKKSHSPQFVSSCDALVYTSAINESDRDFSLAKKLGKPCFSRAEILGMISEGKRTISVAGSHGKTTTTAMLSVMLEEADKSPTAHIGGMAENFGSNVHFGTSDLFVTEACEYKDSFLHLTNEIALVLNLSADHLDYFKTFENYISSFKKFVKNTKKVLITNYDDDNCKKLRHKNVISYSIKNPSDVMAKNIKKFENGRFGFELFYREKKLGNIKLKVMGFHNIYNALAVAAVGLYLKLPFIKIKKGIEAFSGVERRNQVVFESKNCLVLHDYAHHPEEITSTLKTYKELGGKLIAIFQPHTFSRTKDLFDEFVKCFDCADEVWFLPIYPAREKPIKGITSFTLARQVALKGKKVRYFKNFQLCRSEIIITPENKTVYAILGAGDIVELASGLK